jgi:ElaB/YqjD/DUF883 family membrane-anchored ribosome-binding protein
LEKVTFLSERDGADGGRKIGRKSRSLTLWVRQRLRTVRMALKIASAGLANAAKLSPKCQLLIAKIRRARIRECGLISLAGLRTTRSQQTKSSIQRERIIMTKNEAITERLATDLKRVVHDSEELLKDSAGAVGEKAREMRGRLVQTLESAKLACCRLEEKALEGAKATDKVIRAHPYESIGVAFGIGLFIGVLVTRK